MLSLRSMTDNDLPAVQAGLRLPHMARWWTPQTAAEQEIAKHRRRISGASARPTVMLTVTWAGDAIGWCQWHRWADYPAEAMATGACGGCHRAHRRADGHLPARRPLTCLPCCPITQAGAASLRWLSPAEVAISHVSGRAHGSPACRLRLPLPAPGESIRECILRGFAGDWWCLPASLP